MENKVSEILENILGLLALEGSFEVVETDDQVTVTIEANDAGRLIGYRGETLDALQTIVNIIANKDAKVVEGEPFKRVVVDVGNWRKNRQEDLAKRAKEWAEQVRQSGKPLELEPMPAWQRRVVHLALEEVSGVKSQSIGDEGRDRHLVIKPEGNAD